MSGTVAYADAEGKKENGEYSSYYTNCSQMLEAVKFYPYFVEQNCIYIKHRELLLMQ